MICTEEEAKDKWCPMAGNPRASRQDEGCIATNCMAWRWYNDCHGNGGYCGLADKPKYC